MKTPKMVDAMSYIDDDLVSDAIRYKKAKKRQWVKWVSLAACLCVLLLGIFERERRVFGFASVVVAAASRPNV